MMHKITYFIEYTVTTATNEYLVKVYFKINRFSIDFWHISIHFPILKGTALHQYAANNSYISLKISTIIALKETALNKTENLSLHSVAIITIEYTHT